MCVYMASWLSLILCKTEFIISGGKTISAKEKSLLVFFCIETIQKQAIKIAVTDLGEGPGGHLPPCCGLKKKKKKEEKLAG